MSYEQDNCTDIYNLIFYFLHVQGLNVQDFSAATESVSPIIEYDCDSGEDESDCLFSYYPSSTGIDSTTESMIGTDPTTEDNVPENSGE